MVARRREGVGRDDPAPERGRAALARQRLEVVGLHPPPFGDHAVDRARRLRLRRRQHGGHVEHLAATDGLVAPELTEDEPVAGHQGERDREMQTHEPRATRLDRIGAEHPHANRVLAGADVGGERAAAGDVVLQRVEHPQRGVDGSRRPPLATAHQGVTAREAEHMSAAI